MNGIQEVGSSILPGSTKILIFISITGVALSLRRIVPSAATLCGGSLGYNTADSVRRHVAFHCLAEQRSLTRRTQKQNTRQWRVLLFPVTRRSEAAAKGHEDQRRRRPPACIFTITEACADFEAGIFRQRIAVGRAQFGFPDQFRRRIALRP